MRSTLESSTSANMWSVVTSVGLRELRQHASELVRRAEAGEELVVTVSGRPAAMLTSAHARRWRRGGDIAGIWDTPVDAAAWRAEREQLRDLVDDGLRDPWAVRQ